MMMEELNQIARWAVELQSLAQAGLTYGKDAYDRERYQRLREIAADMMAETTGLPVEKVKDLFCNEQGYQTPKLDTRAALFQDGKILLVQERDGLWTLPGGWVDVNLSVKENALKEVKEEAGLDARALRIIAVLDRAKHNPPPSAYGICKVFVLCQQTGGQFAPNLETIVSGYFALEELPPLAESKTTRQQIRMCFDAHQAKYWETIFD